MKAPTTIELQLRVLNSSGDIALLAKPVFSLDEDGVCGWHFQAQPGCDFVTSQIRIELRRVSDEEPDDA